MPKLGCHNRQPTAYCEVFRGSTYTPEQVEALIAVDAYRRRTGRKFLTIVEMIGVLKTLGWRKEAPKKP